LFKSLRVSAWIFLKFCISLFVSYSTQSVNPDGKKPTKQNKKKKEEIQRSFDNFIKICAEMKTRNSNFE